MWPAWKSVNDTTDSKAFRCYDASFNDAVHLMMQHGMAALSAKLDLTDAFKHILACPED